MKRFYAMLVYVPITAGLMVLWPVDEVFTADATAPPPAAATVSSAVASASSAIATASSAIAKASTAIATASSAIATASSAIATDPSSCDTSAAATSAETSIATSTATSAATSTIAGDDCSTVASALRLGHGADDPTARQVDDHRGGTGRGLDIVGPSRLADRFNRVDVRPRTVGIKITEKVILTAVTMFIEKLELALFMSLYKLKLIYNMVIAPVLGL